MITNLTKASCQSKSSKKNFGLRDDDDLNPAYIDEGIHSDWGAIVENLDSKRITFIALDACEDPMLVDGKRKKQCDGVLSDDNKIVFVELKDRKWRRRKWVNEGDLQLRSSLDQFAPEVEEFYDSKMAYICNKRSPDFAASQLARMEKFAEETGFVLRIQGNIKW